MYCNISSYVLVIWLYVSIIRFFALHFDSRKEIVEKNI